MMACCRKHFASKDHLNPNVAWHVSQIYCACYNTKLNDYHYHVQVVRIDKYKAFPADRVYEEYLELVSYRLCEYFGVVKIGDFKSHSPIFILF